MLQNIFASVCKEKSDHNHHATQSIQKESPLRIHWAHSHVLYYLVLVITGITSYDVLKKKYGIHIDVRRGWAGRRPLYLIT